MLRFRPILCRLHGSRRSFADHHLQHMAVPNAPDDMHHVRQNIPDEVEHVDPAQSAARVDSGILVGGVLLENARLQLLYDLLHVHLVVLTQSSKLLVVARLCWSLVARGSVKPTGLAEGVSGRQETAEAAPQSAVNVHPLFCLVLAPVAALVMGAADLSLRWVITAPIQQERLTVEAPTCKLCDFDVKFT